MGYLGDGWRCASGAVVRAEGSAPAPAGGWLARLLKRAILVYTGDSPLMNRVEYSEQQTLEEARGQYFERNGFGSDGGYSDTWVKVKVGPLPFPFPNTAARVRAVRYHDLHHIVTGYPTTLQGEMEIGAWEIATGCRSFPAAWQLNMAALGGGVLVAPLCVLRAYARGRRSRNLYARSFDAALLSTRVGAARAELGLDETSDPPVTPADVAAFVPVAATAIAVALASLVVATPFAIAAWPSLIWAHQRSLRVRSRGHATVTSPRTR